MNRHRGFSLIELMIALTIGLILSVVVSQIFLNTSTVFRSTDNLSRVQENARYALALLTREIRSASYRSDPRIPRQQAYPVATTPGITGTDGGMSASPVSGIPDQITVRFQGSGTGASADGTVQDCIGNRIDYGNMVVNTFLIKNDPANNNEPTLYCNTAVPPAACTDPPAGSCYPLIPSVENFQIVYGEDIGAAPFTPNPDGSVDRWVPAGSVSNWDNVLSVRVALLMRTTDQVSSAVDSRVYAMSGTNVRPCPGGWTAGACAAGTDSRSRRLYTSVINLRNRTQ
ncbi:MAG TPA: PilW family protein [Burkholderiales bacterium]|nr:PilW family protein [Burkholderiales bacterium]